MIREVSKDHFACIDIMASDDAKMPITLSPTAAPRRVRRPLWRTHHLTNALYRAFRRTAQQPQRRHPFWADEA